MRNLLKLGKSANDTDMVRDVHKSYRRHGHGELLTVATLEAVAKEATAEAKAKEAKAKEAKEAKEAKAKEAKEAKAKEQAKKAKEAKEAKEAIKAQIVNVLPPRSAFNVTNFNVTNSGQVSGRQGWG